MIQNEPTKTPRTIDRILQRFYSKIRTETGEFEGFGATLERFRTETAKWFRSTLYTEDRRFGAKCVLFSLIFQTVYLILYWESNLRDSIRLFLDRLPKTE